jgi:ADP-heptose:LPS heptosyltransferase
MRILALQLKRIGDLILTTPTLAALRAVWPEAHIALAVSEGCAALLPAIPHIDTTIVFGRGRGFAPWQQAITGPWDLCLDFTGNDRSALATALSRAKQRATFAWVRRNKVRSLAYSCFVDSPVRDRHTADHYLDLVSAFLPASAGSVRESCALEPSAQREPVVRKIHGLTRLPSDPALRLPPETERRASELLHAHRVSGAFALLHPGTARPEKYWLAERWAELTHALLETHSLHSVITCGPDAFERAHAAEIESRIQNPVLSLPNDPKSKILHPPDLLTLAALSARARIVVSCDTAMVHLAAAFRTPQVALFGPTNPFHWRPRHERAVVISAAQSGAPLTDFRPRMKGAPMERISTEVVIRATETLLSTAG